MISIDPSLPVQDAVEAQLRADTGVKAEFDRNTTRVYTLSAPNKAPYPYYVIGEDQILPGDTECVSGSEVIVTVHCWAREDTVDGSRRKAKALAAAARAALVQKLELDGHVMDDWSFTSLIHLTDTDGLTAHSVLTVTYLTTASV